MKRKIRLKVPFLALLFALISILFLTITTSNKSLEEDNYIENGEEQQISYPVINETNKIIYPFSNESVKVGKNYYDYKAEEKEQENSIIIHDNTYYQNTGIDYVAKDTFDILAISNGTVTSVKEDAATGKTVEIKHDNGLISIYQSLSEVLVKKDEIVSQAQIIGKSGTNELDKDLGNHLHIEIYENGISVNPEIYLGKNYEKKN